MEGTSNDLTPAGAEHEDSQSGARDDHHSASEYEPAAPGAKKRAPKKGDPKPSAKKARAAPSGTRQTAQNEDVEALTSVQSVTLEPINRARTSQTVALNDWDKAVEGGRMQLKGATPAYTPDCVKLINEEDERRVRIRRSTMPLQSMHKADIYEGRRFEVVEVHLLELESGDSDSNSESVTKAKVWQIFVHDSSRPESPRFELYGALVKHEHLTGMLSPSVCPTEDAARELGVSACTLMNRIPLRLDVVAWHSVQQRTKRGVVVEGRDVSRTVARQVIESLALELWRAHFDYSILPQDFVDDIKLSMNASVMQSARAGEQKVRLHMTILLCCEYAEFWPHLRQDLKALDEVVDLWIAIDTLDFNAIHKTFRRLPVPRHFPHRTAELEVDVPESQQLSQVRRDLIHRLVNYVEFNMAGKIGGLKALRSHVRKLLEPFMRVKRTLLADIPKTTTKTGVFGGKIFFVIDQPQHRIVPSHAALASVTQPLPVLRGWGDHNLAGAFVLNQILLALSAGKDSINAWQDGVVALELFRAKEVTKQDFVEQQCNCEEVDGEARFTEVHVCAICWQVRFCADLVSLLDGRHVCFTHVDQLGLEPDGVRSRMIHSEKPGETSRKTPTYHHSRRTYQQKLRSTLLGALALEKGMTPANREFLEKKVGACWVSPHTYQDGYDGIRVVPTHFRFARSGIHAREPMAPSFEAVHPFVVRHTGITYHDHEYSLVTFFALNAIKSIWPVCIVPIVGRAALVTIEERNGSLQEPGIRDLLNTAMDHVHLLTVQFSSTRVTRFEQAAQMSEEEYKLLRRAWEAGVYDASVFETMRGATEAKSRVPHSGGEKLSDKVLDAMIDGTHRRGKFGAAPADLPELSDAEKASQKLICASYTPWTPAQQNQLLLLVKQIEDDKTINPRGLTIPRHHSGAPWPFILGHMFTADENLWDWFHREMVYRVDTWMNICNWEHETRESPATLFGLLIVNWFRTGGVDPYLGFQMTIWVRHPLRFSFGRADHVLPGSPMRSGFNVLFPTDIRLHFNISDMTAIPQPWLVNVGWQDFSSEGREAALVAYSQIAPQTRFYAPLRQDLSSVVALYPKESRIHRRVKHGEAFEFGSEDEDAEQQNSGGPGHGDGAPDPTSAELAKTRAQELQAQKARFEEGLEAFRVEVEAHYGSATVDHDLAALLGNMAEAIGLGDVDRLIRCGKDARTLFDSLKASTMDTLLCPVCQEPAIEGQMVWCMGLGVQSCGKAVHLLCADPTRTEMPATYESMTCLQCRQGISGPGLQQQLPKNLPHLPNSCYTAAGVQVLHSTPVLREIVLQFPKGQICKPLADSGSQGVLPAQYPAILKTDPQKKEKIAEQYSAHMNLARTLADRLMGIFYAMTDHNTAGNVVATFNFQSFMDAGSAYNSDEWGERMNDASALIDALLDCLIMVTDNSDPTGRHGISTINERQNIDSDDGQPQVPLFDDCDARFKAYRGEGHVTPIYDLFALQYAQESICPDLQCSRVRRGYEHVRQLQLSFPEVQYAMLAEGQQGPRISPASYTLQDMLINWATESPVGGLQCMFDPNHTPLSPRWHKRLTRLPPELQVVLSRQSPLTSEQQKILKVPADHYMRKEDVAIPEFLDMAFFSEDVTLPSENLTEYVTDAAAKKKLAGVVRGRRRRAIFGNDTVYRLSAIGMFIGGNHYKAYYVLDNMWIVADDLGGVRPEHPQAAVSNGNLPYFLQYRRLEGWSQLPRDATGKSSHGFIITRDNRDPGPALPIYDKPPARMFGCPLQNVSSCGLEFVSRAAAESHAATHEALGTSTSHSQTNDEDTGSPPENFACKQCMAAFDRFGELEDHIRDQHYHNVCEPCGIPHTSPNELRQHRLDIHQYLECEDCEGGEIFPSPSDLAKHVDEYHPTYKCNHCDNAFGDPEDLREHEAEFHPTCNVCSQQFLDVDTLRDHQRETHAVCNLCGAAFSGPDGLRPHAEAYHCFPCKSPSCDIIYTNAADLAAHVANHPHACKSCAMQCTTIEELTSHRQAEHPIACPACEVDSLEEAAFEAHRITHLPIACPFCTDRFEVQGDLQTHQKTEHPTSSSGQQDIQAQIRALEKATADAQAAAAAATTERLLLEETSWRRQEEEAVMQKAHDRRIAEMKSVMEAAKLLTERQQHEATRQQAEASIRRIDEELAAVLARFEAAGKE
ncbi:hypothetical protein LTR27_008343 [Elasticomyces elasticus]|nr:hypothetical protein LTR27_008343 [Elasticomyces elasticus]